MFMTKILSFLIFLFSLNLSAQNADKDSLLVFELNFELDSKRLTKNEKSRIDSLIKVMPIDIVRRAEIYGHTDSLAGIEYNRKLSKSRVISVLRYLEKRGLDPLDVQTDYFGEERPKYENAPETRYKNRRVEIHFYIATALIPEPDQKLSQLSLSKGDKIQIPNLNFVGNQPIPVWQSFEALQELLLLTKRNPDLKLEIQGHVCCSSNLELSEQRARMVYDFLIVNGVPKNRLTYRGLSNSRPLNKERNPREKALNRRVEILILENSEIRRNLKEGEKVSIDLRTRVLNVVFFPKSGRLLPSGDFMLNLILEMIKESKGLKYEFVVYDNIDDLKTSHVRAKLLKRNIAKARINSSTCNVTVKERPNNMPIQESQNYIILKITK